MGDLPSPLFFPLQNTLLTCHTRQTFCLSVLLLYDASPALIGCYSRQLRVHVLGVSLLTCLGCFLPCSSPLSPPTFMSPFLVWLPFAASPKMKTETQNLQHRWFTLGVCCFYLLHSHTCPQTKNTPNLCCSSLLSPFLPKTRCPRETYTECTLSIRVGFLCVDTKMSSD